MSCSGDHLPRATHPTDGWVVAFQQSGTALPSPVRSVAMSGRDLLTLLKDSGVKFWDDRGPRLGAALAYYSALSLSPLLVVLVAIAGFVFGEAAARGEIVEQLHDIVGAEPAKIIEQLIVKSSVPSEGIIATVIAGLILL